MLLSWVFPDTDLDIMDEDCMLPLDWDNNKFLDIARRNKLGIVWIPILIYTLTDRIYIPAFT